jgi:hypothetical protein
MSSALDGFLLHECDEQLAGSLRAEVEAARGHEYDRVELNLFDLEFFHAESRVTIKDARVSATAISNCPFQSSSLHCPTFHPRADGRASPTRRHPSSSA